VEQQIRKLTILNKLATGQLSFFSKLLNYIICGKLKIMRNVIRQQSSIYDHTFTNLSALPETICCPSGLKATETTSLVCPASDAASFTRLASPFEKQPCFSCCWRFFISILFVLIQTASRVLSYHDI
jgi:hypothetical protein